MNFYSSPELFKQLLLTYEKKITFTPLKTIVLGFLAGAYIGFAGHLATVISTGWVINGEPVFFGLQKFMTGFVFSLGLMMVMIPGSELFTGNNMMVIGLYEKKITILQVLKNWGLVWIANLIGTVFIAWLIVFGADLTNNQIGKTALITADLKTSLSYTQMFTRGILANWLVCIAVIMAIASKDISGKILSIIFPIMAFVASSFEHSIANMYLIAAGLFTKLIHPDGVSYLSLTYLNGLINLIVVSLGNIIGGGFFVSTLYWFSYYKSQDKAI